MKLVIALFALSASLLGASLLTGEFTRAPQQRYVKAMPVRPTQVPHEQEAPPAKPLPVQEKAEVVQLTAQNTVVMDSVFTDQSVGALMVQLDKISRNLKNSDTIYMVINSPGGSVEAGLKLISFCKALPQKVKTLTIFAASMGFQTVQGLDERLIMDSGTLMSHRAKFGCEGEAEGEIVQCMNWIMSQVNALDAHAAERMQMTTPEYKELIRDEYWAFGAIALEKHAADRVVLARCDTSLMGTKTSHVDTIFGTFDVEVSKCPLVPGFFSVKPADEKAKKDTGETTLYVKRMYGDRTDFVNRYIVTNQWTRFQK